MDRLILLIAALVLLMNTGCGDDLGYIEVPEADASIFIPADDCGEGTYFDEDEGECLSGYDDEEEDLILPEPSPAEDEELPSEEEEEEPPACEEVECLPIETPEDPEDPEVPEEPIDCEDDEERNWVYLKSTEDFSPDMLEGMTMGEGCTLPPADPSSLRKHIVVRIDGDADWSNFHDTGWYYDDHPITAISGWEEDCEEWCLEVNGVTYPARASTTNPCEAD